MKHDRKVAIERMVRGASSSIAKMLAGAQNEEINKITSKGSEEKAWGREDERRNERKIYQRSGQAWELMHLGYVDAQVIRSEDLTGRTPAES